MTEATSSNLPASPPKPSSRVDEVKELASRGYFLDPAAQVNFERVATRLTMEFGADTLVEQILIRNVAASEVEMSLQRRARMTALRLHYPAAAREILVPGWNAFSPKEGGYDRSNPRSPHAAFLEHEAYPFAEMSDDELVSAALAKLSRLGLGEEALEDVASFLLKHELEGLERSMHAKQELQTAAIDRIFYLRERRGRSEKKAQVSG